MAKPTERIELNQIDPKDDNVDNLSEKYMSLDENGKPIEDPTKPNQVAHKIAESGAVYAVPNKSKNDADENGKYTRLEEDATSDPI